MIQKFDDCILSCAPDRLAECLQSLIENAIKYGDGYLFGSENRNPHDANCLSEDKKKELIEFSDFLMK